MVSLFTAYQVALIFAMVTSFLLAIYTWKYRDKSGAEPLLVLFVGVILWTFCNFMSVHHRGTQMAIFWSKLWFIGVTLTVLGFFMLALEYTGHDEYLTPKVLTFLSIEPIVLNLVIWIDDDLLWTIGELGAGTVQGFEITPGPAFWGHTAYSYSLLTVGVFLIALFAVQSKYFYQRQAMAILLATIVPWFGNGLYLFNRVPVDLTPIGFTVIGIAMSWAILRAEFLDIMPIARDKIVETLQNGMFVIDRNRRVVDINEAGRTIMGVENDEEIIGKPINDYFGDNAPVETFIELHSEEKAQNVDISAGSRFFTIQTSPLYGIRDEFLGMVFLIHEITEQKRQQNELEAKNEQLDQFASVVSHDLRNPLNVATGYTELARETGDQEHFDKLDSAHERMQTLIDELLTLARQGKQIQQREELTISEVAQNAWNAVETKSATFEVEEGGTIQADPDRFQQLFENCFRNAIEHGLESEQTTQMDGEQQLASNLTIGVGVLENGQSGFYVEDNGSGFDSENPDSVFDPGYTTAEDGTGFGLAIVQTVADAHGWRVSATHNDEGGARFEFREVDSLREA